jgi:predicted enzyme related to lactoylglutathione lyase
MTKTNVANPVSWFEVHAPDAAKAQAFYGELFGWSFSAYDDQYAFIGLGDDAPIGGGLGGLIPGVPPTTIVCVQVPDVAASCGRVVELGGRVIAEPQKTPDGLVFAYVADPDGSVLGVWTPPAA